MDAASIKLEAVSRIYGPIRALDSLSLAPPVGAWVSVTGPSGSGKSTLLHMLGAMDTADEGRVLIDGKDLARLEPAESTVFRRTKVGFVFQQPFLVPYLSAVENVMLAQYFHSVADREEAARALDAVGLGERLSHLPAQLSGGEKQRVCIARALINGPGLLILDEPTGNLDRANTEAVLKLIADFHKRREFTVVCATHDPFVADWGDRRLVLADGKLIEDTEGPARRLSASADD